MTNQGKLLKNLTYVHSIMFLKSLPWPIYIHGPKISFYCIIVQKISCATWALIDPVLQKNVISPWWRVKMPALSPNKELMDFLKGLLKQWKSAELTKPKLKAFIQTFCNKIRQRRKKWSFCIVSFLKNGKDQKNWTWPNMIVKLW